MKNILLLTTMLLFIASCKKSKCVECENVCYYCNYMNETYCSTEFQNKTMLENAIDLIRTNGDSCYQVDATELFKECDEDKQELFKSTHYDCK